MNNKHPKSRLWYVVFSRSSYKYPFHRWLNQDFTHVWAFTRSEGGEFWHVINSTASCLDCDLKLCGEYPHPQLMVSDYDVMIPVQSKIDTSKVRGTICLFNCVEVVKAILGVRKPFVLTPYQLYKYLRCQDG